ncbi:hypothetical protein JZ751_007591, partial [Albula glossodonta]
SLKRWRPEPFVQEEAVSGLVCFLSANESSVRRVIQEESKKRNKYRYVQAVGRISAVSMPVNSTMRSCRSPLVLLLAIALCELIAQSHASKSFEDVRCKCICPPYRNISGHIYNRNVTIIIYLSVVGSLLLYMLFLLLVDPLIRKHDPYTQPLQNEEDTEDVRSQAEGVGGRGNTMLERVEGAQQRWKRQVQEQRKTVFDRHKMLS